MKKSHIQKVGALCAGLAIALTAQVAFAYEELEIEIEVEDGISKVEVEYTQDGEKVESEFEYETTDIDEVYTNVAEELDITVAEVEAALKIEDEEDEEDEENEENEESEDGDDDKVKDKCDGSFPGIGHGVKKQCDSEYEKTHPVKTAIEQNQNEEFKDFGKTTDKVELQKQIQQLLQVLIKLLSQQMMQDNS